MEELTHFDRNTLFWPTSCGRTCLDSYIASETPGGLKSLIKIERGLRADRHFGWLGCWRPMTPLLRAQWGHGLRSFFEKIKTAISTPEISVSLTEPVAG